MTDNGTGSGKPDYPMDLVGELEAERDRRAARLRDDAIASYKAMEGWQRVRSEADWVATVEEARRSYRSGRFLLEQLGAQRYLDPQLMATIWALRQRLREETGTDTVAEAMLVDLTVLGYYNALQVQRWIGNLALLIEHEFFGEDGPAARFEGRHGRPHLGVEDHLRRLREELLPLLDRADRMVGRNLRAIKELRQGPLPAVAIGRAEQVNVADKQINLASPASASATATPATPPNPTSRLPSP